MYVRAGRPAFARPCVGVHKSTSLMSSSLLLQQCPASWVGTIQLQFRLKLLLRVPNSDSEFGTLRSRFRQNCSRIVPTHELIFVILLYLVLITLCNCSIAAFYGGFLFFWPTDCVSLDFFQLVWQGWPFLFFLPMTFLLFTRAVIRDIWLSLNSGVFFSFSWSQ